MSQIKIALAGNPNCGKTTLFNILTGSNQYVGNWPGVTVEKKEGKLKGHKDVVIQDLPGIYSLSPYTLEEVVARSYLVNEKPDAILNIVDGTNIERNLYLTTQLIELGLPVVVAVNMIDLVRKNGDTIDLVRLGSALGCEVVEMSALKGEGGMEAAEKAVALAQEKNLNLVDRPFQTCVVLLDEKEFKSTWLGNKSVYRTRMAMADGGELIILAPGVERFGEDPEVDKLIRKYGYCGRLKVLEQFRRKENQDLRDNMGAAAHLIHGSPDGRFTVTYAVKRISPEEVASVGFTPGSYDEYVQKYDPSKMKYGFNNIDGEEVFYIPNPALGLWINREKFSSDKPF